jgi:hypothetical protein
MKYLLVGVSHVRRPEFEEAIPQWEHEFGEEESLGL